MNIQKLHHDAYIIRRRLYVGNYSIYEYYNAQYKEWVGIDMRHNATVFNSREEAEKALS